MALSYTSHTTSVAIRSATSSVNYFKRLTVTHTGAMRRFCANWAKHQSAFSDSLKTEWTRGVS